MYKKTDTLLIIFLITRQAFKGVYLFVMNYSLGDVKHFISYEIHIQSDCLSDPLN